MYLPGHLLKNYIKRLLKNVSFKTLPYLICLADYCVFLLLAKTSH